MSNVKNDKDFDTHSFVSRTNTRLKELEQKLDIEKKKIEGKFFKSLEPGELLEVTGFQSSVGFYSSSPTTSGSFCSPLEYYEMAPTLSPSDVVMYLGWVDSPGEEQKIVSNLGAEKIIKPKGAKWLIGDKIRIMSISSGLLQPLVWEVEDDMLECLEEVEIAKNILSEFKHQLASDQDKIKTKNLENLKKWQRKRRE